MKNTRYEVNVENYNEDSPILSASIKKLDIEIAALSVYTGAVKTKNVGGGILEGRIFSKNGYTEFTPNEWKENEQVILYRIDTVNLSWGKEYDDHWIVESNGGEHEIFVHIRIINPVLVIDEQKTITTLEEFANFAKNNWNRAKEVFFSPAFSTWFSQNDNLEWSKIHTQLSITTHKDWGLEYFLRLTGVKQSPSLWLQDKRRKVEILSFDKNPTIKGIVLHKRGWGLINIRLETNAAWIKLPKDHFSHEDFKDDKVIINYEILTDRIKSKSEFGYIYICYEETRTPYEIRVTKKDIFHVAFSKKSYSQEDEGVLIIENRSGEDAMVQITNREQWIQFEAKKYLIANKAEIPFTVYLTNWNKWGLGKKPYYETTLEIAVSTKKHSFKENFDIKIDQL